MSPAPTFAQTRDTIWREFCHNRQAIQREFRLKRGLLSIAEQMLAIYESIEQQSPCITAVAVDGVTVRYAPGEIDSHVRGCRAAVARETAAQSGNRKSEIGDRK